MLALHLFYSARHNTDCQDGISNLRNFWSKAKAHWCCHHRNLGCTVGDQTAASAIPGSDLLFDCTAGALNWQSGWSASKKTWCCTHEHLGCEKTAAFTDTTKPYECSVGRANWQSGWSAGKKAWCCENEHVGCRSEPIVSSTYDCHAGLGNSHHGWSEEKKSWCCKHRGVSCHDDGCHMGLVQEWSQTKIARCCQEHGIACSLTLPPYDCEAGVSNWRSGWSPNKKAWCCQHRGLGCSRAMLSKHFGCKYDEAEDRWKCVREGVGRSVASMPDHLECDRMVTPRFQAGWSDARDALCCQQYHLRCPRRSHSDTRQGMFPSSLG